MTMPAESRVSAAFLFFVANGGGATSATIDFPPPWTVEELDARFVVRDQSGQQLAYVCFENERGRRSAAKLLDGL
jgi:hypothetical protein